MAPTISTRSLVAFSCVFALASSHAIIMDATCGQGFSNGFGMVDGIPRDDDSPDFAQVDSAIIRNAENEKNMSNKCGRTLLSNIDVAKETEKALKFNITQCEAGATLKFTLHMVNTDAGGPYSCDMDETNNAGKMTQEIEVTLNAPGEQGLNPDAPKGENFPMTVKLPADMNCKGGTTGNVCTLRCRNLSVAGPFGGCIAIQQIGGKQDDPLLNDPPRIDPPGNSLEPNDQEQNDQEQGGGGRGPRLVRRRVNQAGQSRSRLVRRKVNQPGQGKKSQSKKVVNKNIKANGGGGGNNDNKDKDNGGKGGDGGGKNDINNKNNNNDKNDNDKNNDNGNDNGGKGGDGGNNKNNDNNNKNNNGGNGENNDFAPGTKIVSPDQIRTQDKAEAVKKLSEELNISVPKLIKEREDAERGDKAGGENQDQGAGVVGAKEKKQPKKQPKKQQKGGQDKKQKQKQ